MRPATGNSGGNTSIREGHYLSSPLIIIPDSLVDVRTNDEVVVTVENSRIIRFLALEAEAVADPDVGGVTVWLNKGDDQNG